MHQSMVTGCARLHGRAVDSGAEPRMAVAQSLDLSNLYRHPVFRSRSTVESHRELNNAITEHQLRWGRGDVSTALYRRELGRIGVMVLSYGAEVEVTPQPFKDFSLVQMPLSGAAEIECDGIATRVERGEVAVLSPRRSVRLLWQPQCEQLILKVPSELLRQVACLHCGVSHCPSPRPAPSCGLDPVFKLPSEFTPTWQALVQQLLALLPSGSGSGVHPAWLNQFEQTAASFLHTHQPSVLLRDLGRSAKGEDKVLLTGHSPAKLEQLEAYMRSRLYAPISLVDLANAIGVSPRTLHVLCHRHRGVAPMVLLRQLRLDAARRRLLSEPGTSVTDVALAFGFGHLGRFSAYYRERFGELPRDTRLVRH